jgi:hypothetical protein
MLNYQRVNHLLIHLLGLIIPTYTHTYARNISLGQWVIFEGCFAWQDSVIDFMSSLEGNPSEKMPLGRQTCLMYLHVFTRGHWFQSWKTHVCLALFTSLCSSNQ